MAKITATFSIWSKILHPDQISAILSAVPDRVVLRGLDREPPRQVPDAYGWHVVCRDEKELLAEATLLKLLYRVSILSEKIAELKKLDQTLDIRFAIGIRPFEDSISLLLSHSTVRALNEMESSLDIEFFPDDD